MFSTTRRSLAAVAVMAVVAGCGGDDVAETDGDEPTPAGDTTAAADETEDAGGQVTLDGQTWDFVPRIQCSVREEVVSIAGHAEGEPDREIVFDVFEPQDVRLRISADELGDWSSTDIDADVDADARTVSGRATMELGAETAEATFDFNC